MVFRGGQPSGRKKTTIGYRQKYGPNPADNDPAECSCAGVTAQVQCYGRIGMHSAAAVTGMSRNDFLTRSITKNKTSNEQRGLFHVLPEELRMTAVMVTMDDALQTRPLDNMSDALQREIKQKKKNLENDVVAWGGSAG